MATYYLNSGAGGAATGADWTNAFLTYTAALAAATADGDIIKVHKTHTEELGVDTIYTYGAHISVICVDKDASDALATMGTAAWIGNSTTNRSVALTGAKKVFHYGLTFRTAGTTSDFFTSAGTNGAHHVFENCYIWNGNSSASGGILIGATDALSLTEFVNTTLRFANAGQTIFVRGDIIIRGGDVSSAGTAPTSLFTASGNDPGGASVEAEGFDTSFITGNLVGNCTAATMELRMTRCKLGTGVTMLAAQTHATGAGPEVWLFGCDDGDEHFRIAHASNLGSTICDTGIYVTADAEALSWKIVSTAAASFYAPYRSPWIDKYNSDVSTAITPYIEILRDLSATAYQNDEVWGEWTYKGTTGVTNATFVNDRMTILGTAANQDAGTGTGNWTGENATAWSGKVAATASFTPAEIGHIRGRVVVGEPSTTVYVSPRVRV